MAHKHEMITTGDGYKVKNDGVEEQVINQDGTLATGIVDANALGEALVPTHVVKFAGTSASETDADATVTIALSGASANDVASAVLRAATNDVYVKKAVLTSNTLTVTLSGNGGAGTTVDYVVYRSILTTPSSSASPSPSASSSSSISASASSSASASPSPSA